MNALVENSTKTDSPRAQSVALIARDLVSSSGGVRVLDQTTLRVDRGQLVAIVGKSEPATALFNRLTGFAFPADDGEESGSAGSVQVGIQDLSTLNDDALTLFRQRNIGLIHPVVNLVPTLSSTENVLFTAHAAGVRVPDDRLERLLTLGQIPNTAVQNLSQAQAQIIAAARALALQAPIIIGRNPLAYLDPVGAAQVMQFLYEAAHQLDQGILLIGPSANEMAQADRTLYLEKGKVVTAVMTEAPSAYTGAPALPTISVRTEDELEGSETPKEFPLRDALEQIAPSRPLSEEQQRLLVHAQEILESLPGPVVGIDPGAPEY